MLCKAQSRLVDAECLSLFGVNYITSWFCEAWTLGSRGRSFCVLMDENRREVGLHVF